MLVLLRKRRTCLLRLHPLHTLLNGGESSSSPAPPDMGITYSAKRVKLPNARCVQLGQLQA